MSMELLQNLDRRDVPVRALLAVGLAAYALRSFRNGERVRGAVAGLAAVALGYRAATASGGVLARLTGDAGTDRTTETGQLRCAACGDPIVAGQARTPNGDSETVHEACLEAAA